MLHKYHSCPPESRDTLIDLYYHLKKELMSFPLCHSDPTQEEGDTLKVNLDLAKRRLVLETAIYEIYLQIACTKCGSVVCHCDATT